MLKFFKLILTISLSVSALTLPGISSAQEPLGFSVLSVEIKPGTNQQFEAFIRKFKEGAENTNAANGWATSQTAVGNTSLYSFVSPFNSFEELSTPVTALLGQAFTPFEAAEMLESFSEVVISSTSGTYHAAANISKPAAEAIPNPEVISSIAVNINPGMQIQFEAWVEKVVEASDGPTWNAFSKSFGEGPDYVFRTPGNWALFDNGASSAQQRVLDEFGSREGQIIVDSGNAATQSRSNSLLTNRPDLSYTP